MEDHESTTPVVSSNDTGNLVEQPAAVEKSPEKPVEIGGPKGPEPTRYGDWEKAGRCSDF